MAGKKLTAEEKRTAKATLWRAGKLRWKLHASQKEVYDKYRAWEAHALEERTAGRRMPGLFPRIFQFDISRRWGKDFLGLLIRLEDAIRKPGGHFTYATAYAKDIAGIVVPLFHQLVEDCPLDVKPEFKQSFQGTEAGLYFPNGSVVKLIGIDRNPDGLRGRFSDGVTISEGGFVDRLEYAIMSVLMPQLQGRLGATIIVNSTPPEIPGTWYDTHLTADCAAHDRNVLRTIDDNPLLSQVEKDEFIDAAGGRDHDRCKREYFCIRLRSDDLVVLPEFSQDAHVRVYERPRWARGFTVIDPGVRDLCGVITGYYDFERAQMVVKRCWAKRGANTLEVAQAIRELENDVFGPNSAPLQWWNGRALAANPAQRFSDTEARMILDLSTIHQLRVAAADKQDREAALNALRVAIKTNKIVIDPGAKELIAHCTNAVWNQQRTSYARDAVHGHFDLVDCLLYAWRMVSPSFRTNPVPPAGHQAVLRGQNRHNTLWHAGDWSNGTSVFEKLSKILPKRGRSHSSSARKT